MGYFNAGFSKHLSIDRGCAMTGRSLHRVLDETACGLRISEIPTSDNLKPQETTNHDAAEAGADGAVLSGPGHFHARRKGRGRLLVEA